MNVDERGAREPEITKRRWHLPVVWIMPALAVAIGLWMLLHAWLSTGPQITIRFHTAAGLTAGKTPVKYRDVVVGTVSSIELTDDGTGVLAAVTLSRSAKSLANEGSRFWVVRPRFGVGGLSGVETLLSGAYIAVDKGTSRVTANAFDGLETPPTVINGTPGTTFVLHADDLGSLDVNSPVYYRRIQVGRIASFRLDNDGRGVTLQVFVDAPYDRFVTADSRFWNASGVDIALGAGGIKVNTQSLATVVAGGIAFATPDFQSTSARPASFVLAKDEQSAMAPPKGRTQRYVLEFLEPLRGLSPGAPVVFSGVEVGSVRSISLDYDRSTHRFPTLVAVDVFPDMLGSVLQRLPPLPGTVDEQAAAFLGMLVKDGLRAQARPGNLLTGQLYISMDFVPHAAPVRFDPSLRPLRVPTIPGGFDHIEDQVASILGKLDRMPLEDIGQRLDSSLTKLDVAIASVNDNVLPQTGKTLEQAQAAFGQVQNALSNDAPWQQNLARTLDNVDSSARSLRTLTDLLGRHPDALLRGIRQESETSSQDNRTPLPEGSK